MGIQTKTKTRKPGVKPPRTSLRDVVMDTRNLLLQFMNEQHEFNKQQLEFNKRQDERWEHQEEFNKQISTLLNNIIKLNNLKTK
mgnify:CR=1 FL=1